MVPMGHIIENCYKKTQESTQRGLEWKWPNFSHAFRTVIDKEGNNAD